MRRFASYEIFTVQLTNSGSLDERYSRLSGNSNIPSLNSGLFISGQNLIVDSTGFFNNGIKISGSLILNGRNILVTELGNVYSPSITTFGTN